MPFPFLGENKELDESIRKEAAGSFIQLTDGVTHYELGGPETGESVVLVHGFSGPYFIFDPTFEFLTKAGFRVLRYDLFGRGYSDRPHVPYDIHLFVRQLKDLLDELNFRQVHFIGLSLGGPITACFIQQYPEYMKKYVLIDPAGAKQTVPPWPFNLLKLPILGELALGLFGNAGMVKNIASDRIDVGLVDHFRLQFKIQMQFKGFKQAILSTLRNHMLDSFLETYQFVGRLNKPTLLFWGKNDTTAPFENSKIITEAIPQTEFYAIENSGHIPHYEQPDVVNKILLGFLLK